MVPGLTRLSSRLSDWRDNLSLLNLLWRMPASTLAARSCCCCCGSSLSTAAPACSTSSSSAHIFFFSSSAVLRSRSRISSMVSPCHSSCHTQA